MSYKSSGFKKFLLTISGVLFIAFFASAVLLLLRVDEILGSGSQMVLEPTRTPEEQQMFENLPESGRYRLRRNATDYQIELFEQLVNAHNDFQEDNSMQNVEAYASAIVRNFIADFYTLSNKNTRTDVGGLQFFSRSMVNDFRNYAIDTFYLYLNQHTDAFGNESLPTVASTTILSFRMETRTVPVEEDELDSDEIILVYNEFWEVIGQEIMTIVIESEWHYEQSSLWQIDQFQTSARFILIQDENDIRLYAIESIPETHESGW